MRALLTTWARAAIATWPVVAAWYLGGALVREAVLAIAAPLGAESALGAYLLLPIAVLARLVAYIGMVLAVRRAMPAAQSVTGGRDATGRARFGAFMDVLLSAIVPFFVLYGLIGDLRADLSSYANRAALYSLGLQFLDAGTGPLTVTVIVVAFALRLAFRRLGERLPRWTGLLEIYLEAVWIFVAVSGIATILGPITTWVQQRQVVHLVLEARQWLRSLADPIRIAIDGVDGLVPVLLQLIALPLAWLLIAGVVHTRELAALAEERVVPRRVEARLRLLLGRMPGLLARRQTRVREEWEAVYRPLSVTARLILRMDRHALAGLLAVSALLVAGGQWALAGVVGALGPHEYSWWVIAYPIVSVALSVVVETLRIQLLCAAFDRAIAARGISAPARSAAVSAAGAAPSAAAALPSA